VSNRNIYRPDMVTMATMLSVFGIMNKSHCSAGDFRATLSIPMGYVVSDRLQTLVRKGLLIVEKHPEKDRINQYSITKDGEQWLENNAHTVQEAGSFELDLYLKDAPSEQSITPRLNAMPDLFSSQLGGIDSLKDLMDESGRLLADLKHIRQILEKYIEDDEQDD